jgi:hypothetical protein
VGNIGNPIRKITLEPIPDDIPVPEIVPEAAPEPRREPERKPVPA